jgi:hypothetical protein
VDCSPEGRSPRLTDAIRAAPGFDEIVVAEVERVQLFVLDPWITPKTHHVT